MPFTSPTPTISSVGIDSAGNAELHGTVGTSTAGLTWLRWEVDMSGALVMVGEAAHDLTSVGYTLNSLFVLPVGFNLFGKHLILRAYAQSDASQRWASAPLQLVDPNWNRSLYRPPPSDPSRPVLGPQQGPTLGGTGPGVPVTRTRDFSDRA